MVAARANAALAERTTVSEEDLEVAAQLVLLPRAKIETQNKETRQFPKQDSEESNQSDSVKGSSQPEDLVLSERSEKSENVSEEIRVWTRGNDHKGIVNGNSFYSILCRETIHFNCK